MQGLSKALNTFLSEVLHSDNIQKQVVDSDGTNRHFKITRHDHGSQKDTSHYFLKVFVTNSLQVVNRQQQFHIQQQLAQHGLSPEPLALSSCGQFWLEQWCETESIQAGASINTDSIVVLATALAKIHQSNVTAPDLDVHAEWLRYLEVAGDTPQRYGNKINVLLSSFSNRHTHPDDFCFCHNDLHLSHILATEPLRIVDWEYSAIGNRYFDLAACAMVNEFNKNQTEIFIDQYSTIARIPLSKVTDGVEALLPVVDFTNELWHNAYNRIT